MTNERARAALWLAVIVGSGACAAPAEAQSSTAMVPPDSVSGRSRPEYDATGMRIGGFTLYPEAAVTLNYDDNVFRAEAAKRADSFVALAPRLRLQSNATPYSAQIVADATVRRYARTTTENSNQYGISAQIGVDVAQGIRLQVQGARARRIEPRGAAGDIFIGGRPVEYDLTSAAASATRDAGRVSLELGGNVARYVYRPARVGGARVSQAFRNYNTRNGHVQLGYAVGPAISVFALGTVGRSTYPGVRAIDRSSTDASILGGVELGITNLVTGSAAVGYLHQSFDSPLFRPISGLDYAVTLNWSPTPLITLTVNGERGLERSPFLGAGGGIATELGAGIEYEPLRPLVLTANVNQARESFTGLLRRDRRIESQIGARYLASRLIGVTAALNYRHQSSTGLNARNFGGFGASIGLRLHR